MEPRPGASDDRPLTPESFARATGVSRETIARLETYGALLDKWNRRINLVSRAGMTDLWRRHMLDSAQILDLIPAGSKRLLDFGSGAGFPGLVLAILGVEGVELIESDGRKCAFLAEAARLAEVSVIIHNQRIEEMSPLPADVITARACSSLAKLCRYAQPFWAPHTCMIALKGAHIDDELTEATKCWSMQVERHPSLTDPRATVLCIRHLQNDKKSRQNGR